GWSAWSSSRGAHDPGSCTPGRPVRPGVFASGPIGLAILAATLSERARRQPMANLVVHFEIHASEPQKLIDFYSDLLGWTFQSYGGGDQPYWVIDTGEGAIGNVAGRPGMGINGGLTQRMGPRPEIGAPVNGCNI